MTRSAALALSFAGATVAVWAVLSVQGSTLSGADAVLAWNVSIITQLSCYAGFILAALIAHFQPDEMSVGRRVAWRIGAFVLAMTVGALSLQVAVLAAAGYAVFVLASDVRRRRQEQLEAQP